MIIVEILLIYIYIINIMALSIDILGEMLFIKLNDE